MKLVQKKKNKMMMAFFEGISGKVRRLLLAVLASTLALGARARVAAANDGVKKLGPIQGIDLFGRVPHDEWLFKTSNLVSKDFLKPSIVEAVKNELPIVLENFRRRQRVDNLLLMGKIGIFAFLLANALGLGYKYLMVGSIQRINKRYGGSRNIAAISKKGKTKGRQIEGQDDGYIDMEYDEDDDVDSMGFPIRKGDDDNDDDDNDNGK